MRAKQADLGSLNWRPDFRDTELLPDIKAVRSGFFLSALVISATLAMVVYLGFREYQKVTLSEANVALQAEIEQRKEAHKAKVALNRDFMQARLKLDEKETFLKGQMIGSDFALNIARSLESDIALGKIEYTPKSALITGQIYREADTASGLVDTFIANLKENAPDQGFFSQYDLTSLEREGEGFISFRIELSNPEEKKKPARKRRVQL